MNEYLRNFEVTKTKTYSAKNVTECRNLMSRKGKLDFKLYHANIRSLSRHLDELKVNLVEMGESFDCVVLSETFCLTNLDTLNIDGYQLLYNDGKVNKNDGTVVYIRSDLDRYHYKVVQIGCLSCLQVVITKCGRKIVLSALYRPPSTSIKDFNNHLTEYLKKLRGGGTEREINVFVGDININILDDKDADVQDYLNILSENGFVSAINSVTRVDGDIHSCIDHEFVLMQLVFPEYDRQKIERHFMF